MAPSLKMHEKHMLLTALYLSKLNHNSHRPSKLSEVEFGVYSQWGEDGIIDWLVNHLPSIPKTFIEFGVEDYREANTRLLMKSRNWGGVIIDGSLNNIQKIKKEDIYWRHDITAIHAFIDAKNINSILKNGGMEGEVGLLSIDIDGNDYWIWGAIDVVSPVVVVCEYNAVLGDILSISVPYRDDFFRTKAHYSNLYFGASIQALISLAKDKGYIFIGTSTTGANAFFVRSDHAHTIKSFLTEEAWAFPSRFRESRNCIGELTFLNRNSRYGEIKNLPFIDVISGKVIYLRDFNKIYSEEWLAGRGRIL